MAKEKLYDVGYGRRIRRNISRDMALELINEKIAGKDDTAISTVRCDEKTLSKSERLKFIKEAKELSN